MKSYKKKLNGLKAGVIGAVITLAVGSGGVAFGGAGPGPGNPGKDGKQSLVKFQPRLKAGLSGIEKAAEGIKSIVKKRKLRGGHFVLSKASKVIGKAKSAKGLVKNLHLGGKHAVVHKKKRLKDSRQKISSSVQELRQAIRQQGLGRVAPGLRHLVQRLSSSAQSYAGTVERATAQARKVVCLAKDTKEFNRPGAYKGVAFDRGIAKKSAIKQCRSNSSAYRPNCVVVRCS